MTSTGFGWAKYNEKIYEYDIIILVDGTVRSRNEEELRRKFGTMHAIGIEEIQILMSGNPEVIIIGTGQSGELKIMQAAKDYIIKNRINVVEGISPKACKYFDNTTGKKAALIHVTC
jgi:hypothetical protein